ncbi:MAG: hypothetical protein ACKV2U_23945 [Bryobacteraceae bacterium]
MSRHANALKPYDGTGFSGKTLRERGGTLYTYTADKVAITRDGARREAPIQWIFGAGHFARTLLLKQDGRWVEHRISQYPAAGRLSLTPGHVPQPADSFDTAFGIIQSEVNAQRCFACHSTSPMEPGIHCQRCHGEGKNHPNEPTVQRTKAVALCAECHRSPNREYASPEPEIEDPASIRFAPVGLLASKCYQASKGELTCVTCHDPHTDAKPSTTYDKTCQSCHLPDPKKDCPRTINCAGCHMPRSSPIPLLTFTDHRIR